jgi:hypothetical protein
MPKAGQIGLAVIGSKELAFRKVNFPGYFCTSGSEREFTLKERW